MASKKQQKITVELMARSLHALDELDIPYAVVIEGTNSIFSNVSKRHALTILRDAVELQDKIYDKQLDELAERLADTKIHPDEGSVAN